MDRKELKQLFEDKGITECEIRLTDCWRNNALSFAHLHKRDWYRNKERKHLLWDFSQVILACVPCHQIFDYDISKDEFNSIFAKLRPPVDF